MWAQCICCIPPAWVEANASYSTASEASAALLLDEPERGRWITWPTPALRFTKSSVMVCRGACNFYVRGGQTKKPEQLQKATRKDSHSEFRIYHCVHGPEDDSVPCAFMLSSPAIAATVLQHRQQFDVAPVLSARPATSWCLRCSGVLRMASQCVVIALNVAVS